MDTDHNHSKSKSIRWILICRIFYKVFFYLYGFMRKYNKNYFLFCYALSSYKTWFCVEIWSFVNTWKFPYVSDKYFLIRKFDIHSIDIHKTIIQTILIVFTCDSTTYYSFNTKNIIWDILNNSCHIYVIIISDISYHFSRKQEAFELFHVWLILLGYT